MNPSHAGKRTSNIVVVVTLSDKGRPGFRIFLIVVATPSWKFTITSRST